MFTNFSISQLSLQLFFLSPFISQPHSYGKAHFSSFFRLSCQKFSYSYLYSKSNCNVRFKQSTFSKFNGQCPIILNSQTHNFHMLPKNINYYSKSKNNEEKDNYKGDKITSTLFFYTNLDTSVTIQQCTFMDCVNDISQGGAISFRRSHSSLTIQNCIFLRCKSYQSSGAIFALQLIDGNWIIGSVSISNSQFEECYDCNSDEGHEYVAGVIECRIGKGDYNYGFHMTNSKMLNCEFDKKNRITEAQIRLNSNIFHISHSNTTNSNQKVDLSAIIFNKYVQERSSITFFTAFNQYGFSFFEIYDLESSYIEISQINMINTTFVNYDKDMILNKIAFFNIYFEHENSLFLENFFIVDFTTVVTDDKLSANYTVIQPVIIQIPPNCRKPITRNIFSNQKFDRTNLVNYSYFSSMNYDYQSNMIIGLPVDNQTSSTDDVIYPTEITASYSNEIDLIINKIIRKSEKNTIKREVIIVLLIVLTVVISNFAVIEAFKIKKTLKEKNFSFQIDNNENFGEYDSDEQIKKENKLGVDHSANETTYDLFFNPNCRSQIINLSKQKLDFLSELLKNNDPFVNDFEEVKLN